MEIWHRVTFNATSKPIFLETIKGMKLNYKTLQLPGGGGLLVFLDIAETNSNWPAVSRLISSLGAADLQETIFSEEEIRSAAWLRMICVFEQGYPQPKMTWPFNQPDRELLCPKCAIYRQIAPMHIAKEPHLGRKAFMTTILTHEIFCTPAVLQGLQEIQATGYEDWDVILHKTGQVSQRVRQLFIPTVARPGALLDKEHPRTVCPQCGTVKYEAHMRGVLPIKSDALPPNTDFMLTHEWFGSGYFSWREIIVSNRIAQLVLDKGWQGIRFKVVEIV